MSASRFPTGTAVFEMPCLARAMGLFLELESNWVGWIENGLDGTFVVVLAPERISELNRLLASVEKWFAEQAFLAIRLHLDGRLYIMQRAGSSDERISVATRPADGRTATDR